MTNRSTLVVTESDYNYDLDTCKEKGANYDAEVLNKYGKDEATLYVLDDESQSVKGSYNLRKQ